VHQTRRELDALTEKAEAQAREWSTKVDPSVGVGQRHHTVPKFYLRRFANSDGQLRVRDRNGGNARTQRIDDLAIKDFYTFIDKDGQPDGSMEQLFSVFETAAAESIAALLSPFRPRDQWSVQQQVDLAQMLSFQLLRGLRTRREIELQTDWLVKTHAGNRLTTKDRDELRFLPHPNEHARVLTIAEELFPYIAKRPVTLVTFDTSLLMTCDEPVLLNYEEDDHVVHGPHCGLSDEALARRRRKNRKGRHRIPGRIIHYYRAHPSGVFRADEILFPLSPRALLLLGPLGSETDPLVRLTGDEAREGASRLNEMVIANAYAWVAASPGHPYFETIEFPPPRPLIQVCDGGSIMSQQLNAAPAPRRPQLLRGLGGQRVTSRARPS
jgi:hypothetical protein